MTDIVKTVKSGSHEFQTRLVLAAGTADELVVWRNPFGQEVYITEVAYIPDNAITGDDTNNMALALRNKGTAGTGTTAITSTRTFNVAGGNVAAMDETALTVSATAANKEIGANEVVALNKTEAGTGMALSGVLRVQYQFKGVL